MTATIRQTIESAVPEVRGYPAYLDAAVDALEKRDAEIADNLRDLATDAGMPRSEATNALIEVGLLPQPVESAAPDDSSSRDGLIAELNQMGRRIQEYLRQIGG